MGEKIVELQGIRCIAIISVLLFHIWPETFGNGFLGVDVFFVVSGYIMAMILLSSNSLKKSFFTTTLIFYYRRIYRILPLYLLNILITLLIVPVFSYTFTYADLLGQTKSALSFTTNFAMLWEKQDYFQSKVFLYYFYKHYWSLCVEMQFYAIVPFLLYFSKRLPLLASLFLIWPILIIACVGLIFFMLFKYQENGALFTFTMLPARIYEFLGGFIAFHAQQTIEYYSDKNFAFIENLKKIINNVITKNLLTVSLIILTLFPIKLIDIYTLPATIILTSALIISIARRKEKNEMQYSLLANRFCTFIGDASYSLYICHWIVVFLCKLVYGDTEQLRQLMLIACFIVGIIIHIVIEKPIVKARMKPEAFLPWIIGLYFAIWVLTKTTQFEKPASAFSKDLFHNQSKHIGNMTEWNEILLNIQPDTSAELGLYSWKELCNNAEIEWKSNGTLKVLIIGNSHATCIVPGISLAMKGIYSEISVFAGSGLTPFEGFRYSKQIPELRRTVKTFKPDVIFLIWKYMDDFEDPPPAEGIDFRIEAMQEMINFLSNNSKILYVSKMHMEIPRFSALKYAEQIYRYGWTKDYGVEQKDIEESHKVSTERWSHIKCKECIFIDMLEAFCRDGWCSPLDESRKVPIYFDDNHVNKFGAHLLASHIQQKYFKPIHKLLEKSKK